MLVIAILLMLLICIVLIQLIVWYRRRKDSKWGQELTVPDIYSKKEVTLKGMGTDSRMLLLRSSTDNQQTFSTTLTFLTSRGSSSQSVRRLGLERVQWLREDFGHRSLGRRRKWP